MNPKSFVVPFVLAALGGFAAAQAAEHQSSREEVVGVGSGAVVGALAGGPIGAVAGAVAGSLLGDRMHRSEARRLAASQALETSESRLAALQQQLARSESSVASLVREARDARALAAQLRFDVMFRTNEATLPQEAELQLGDLAALLEAYPELTVRLEGYADPRGSESDNERLAAERARAVLQNLLGAGVAADRLDVQSYGERQSRAREGDLDGYAFERRVSISLGSDERSTVAQNRDR